MLEFNPNFNQISSSKYSFRRILVLFCSWFIELSSNKLMRLNVIPRRFNPKTFIRTVTLIDE